MADYLQLMKNVLIDEAKALESAGSKITLEHSEHMISIFKNLHQNGGSLIVSGVGKSGNIAQKIASTFSSLGLPSFFLHPIEALHGDLGRVSPRDAIIYISKSGTTEEILKVIPFIDVPKNMKIALVGNVSSAIAEQCGVVFDCSVSKEACLNNQAPTTSSTVALGVGDALAVLYEKFIGLSKEGFAVNHPGGFLGKSLRLKVKNLMIDKNECALVNPDALLKEALIEMTQFPLGLCLIADSKSQLHGIIVEGDIRRALNKSSQVLDRGVKEIMNPTPVTVNSDQLAIEALELMEKRERPISVVPVVENDKLVGVIRVHDLVKEGLG